MDAAAIGDLRRLAGLSALELRPAGAPAEAAQQAAAAAAGLLSSLHLEQFRWYGIVTADLRAALAGQVDLHELELPLIDDLGFAARLPKLARLTLRPRLAVEAGESGSATLRAADLAPLRASKSLRHVDYCDSQLNAETVAELQQALGEKITLQLHLPG